MRDTTLGSRVYYNKQKETVTSFMVLTVAQIFTCDIINHYIHLEEELLFTSFYHSGSSAP